MTAAAVKYANLEKYVYWLLLATIAVIPLQQEVSSAMVAVTGFSGFIVAFLRRHEKRKPVLPRFVQILLWLLLLLGYWSLHNSADEVLSTYNFIYVVGQYALLVWLILHYAVDKKTSAAIDLDLHKWMSGDALANNNVFLGMSLFVSVYGIVQHFTGVVPT